MTLRIKYKGSKILAEKDELLEYMDKKIRELGGLATNVVTALIMVSMIVVLNFTTAADIYYYALILLPIVGRYYIGNMIIKWLQKQFKELLEI